MHALHQPITRLHAFYDGQCQLCQTMRWRFESEAQWVPVHFLAYQSPDARHLLPHMEAWAPHRRIVVLADTGEVFLGEKGWIAILWATVRWRNLSLTLASPIFNGLVRRVVEMISENRYRISRFMEKHAWETVEPVGDSCGTDGQCQMGAGGVKAANGIYPSVGSVNPAGVSPTKYTSRSGREPGL